MVLIKILKNIIIRPDIVVINKEAATISLIDVAVPADTHISAKEGETHEVSRSTNRIGEIVEEENNNDPHSNWRTWICHHAAEILFGTFRYKLTKCLSLAKDCVVRNSYHSAEGSTTLRMGVASRAETFQTPVHVHCMFL